jgi:hypothetical protein
LTERDPYAVLGVPVHADAEAIAAAYRDQARRHHPDVSDAPDAERRMAEINAAWAMLRDPAKRAAWDRANLGAAQPRHAPAAGSGAYDPYAAQRRTGSTPGRAGTGSAPGRPPSGSVRPGPGAHGTPPQWRRGPNGEGAAGPPPGPRSGSVLPFGRHIGWSVGEIARADPGYLVWLKERREGAPYRAEIEALLGAMFGGPAAPPPPQQARRRGPFR